MAGSHVYEVSAEEGKRILACPAVGKEFLEDCQRVAGKYRKSGTLSGMERILFRDQGTVHRQDGQVVHKIDFALACDRKSFGRDRGVFNPYLKSYRIKDVNGIVKISHADYLPEPVYQRLVRYAVNNGIASSSTWDGMIDARIHYFMSDQGKKMAYVDLTEQAERNGDIGAPVHPFCERAHDAYIKASLAQLDERSSDINQEMEGVVMAENTEQSQRKNLTRVVVKDLGLKTGKDGRSYHRMNFSYACDQMTIGKDTPMAYTYLQAVSRNKKSGKIYTSCDCYLSEDVYDRLMAHVLTVGCENSKWAGVVNAEVQKYGTAESYRTTLNLSEKAVRKGLLQKPDAPFDEAKHNAFVRTSQKEQEKQRIAGAERRLPDVAVDIETSKDKALGE